MSATQVLQRQRSVLLATSSLATRGTPTPRATTEMVSPKLGRGLVASDNIIDLSEGVKPSNQKVRGWEACGGTYLCMSVHAWWEWPWLCELRAGCV